MLRNLRIAMATSRKNIAMIMSRNHRIAMATSRKKVTMTTSSKEDKLVRQELSGL